LPELLPEAHGRRLGPLRARPPGELDAGKVEVDLRHPEVARSASPYDAVPAGEVFEVLGPNLVRLERTAELIRLGVA